jgi:hypothetical protein
MCAKKHPLTMMACSSTSSPSPPSDFIIICLLNDYKSDYNNYYNLEHFIYQLVQDDESNEDMNLLCQHDQMATSGKELNRVSIESDLSSNGKLMPNGSII